MSDTTITLYEPINTLKAVAPDLWVVDGPVVRMAFPGGSLPFPTRMVVVRLRSGALWIHSPTELTPELREQIEAIGPVAHLISPNAIHYAWIPQWAAAWPDAIAWASPGVRERAASQHIEVHFQADLGEEPPEAWAGEIDQIVFHGSRVLTEVVFHHRASRTVLLADLIENFEPERVHGPLRWLVRLAGAADPDGKTPIDLRSSWWGHKAEGRACRDRLLAWEPERVILAHGRWYPSNGTEELRRAFRWLD